MMILWLDFLDCNSNLPRRIVEQFVTMNFCLIPRYLATTTKKYTFKNYLQSIGKVGYILNQIVQRSSNQGYVKYLVISNSISFIP